MQNPSGILAVCTALSLLACAPVSLDSRSPELMASPGEARPQPDSEATYGTDQGGLAVVDSGGMVSSARDSAWVRPSMQMLQYCLADSTCYLAQYQDGILNGILATWKKGRPASKVEYIKGRKNGAALYWDSTGRVVDSSFYVEDSLRGESVAYFSDGGLMERDIPDSLWGRRSVAFTRDGSRRDSTVLLADGWVRWTLRDTLGLLSIERFYRDSSRLEERIYREGILRSVYRWSTVGKESSIYRGDSVVSRVFTGEDGADSVLFGTDSGYSRRASEIMAVVRTETPYLRRIYNSYLEQFHFEAKVKLKFTIGPKGDILWIANLGDPVGAPDEFAVAIIQAVATWRFAEIDGGNTTVTVPFTFSE